MTATYDGKLTYSKGKVYPCCQDMHEAILFKAVYTAPRSTKVFMKISDKVGRPITRCPFCGSEVTECPR